MSSLPKSANVLVGSVCAKRKTYQRVGASLLLVLFLASSFIGFIAPKKATAQGLFVPVYDQAVVLELGTLNGIAGSQLAATESLTIKETILDMILFGLINTIIDQIGNEVVKWIEGGFEGQPGFIQDPGGFMVGVGDQLSGQLIANLGLENFLCDPFQFPSLQLGLSLKFGVGYGSAHRKFYCTVLRAVDIQTKSVKGFLEGDFGAQGGWDMWADIAVNNQNVIGAASEASVQIDKRLASLLGMESNKLNWGSGFLSKTNIKGYIETPGKVVENTLNDTFDSGRRRIEVADEISEIVGALISVAMKSVMTGLGGGGTGVSFTSNYSGGIPSFSASDYEAAKARGLPVKAPPPTNSNLPAISGTLGGTQVYASSATEGPTAFAEDGWPNRIQYASLAIDGNKNVQMLHSSMAYTTTAVMPWWKATLSKTVPLNNLKIYQALDYYDHRDWGSRVRLTSLKPRFYNIDIATGNEVEVLNVSDGTGALVPIACRIHYTNSSGTLITQNGCTLPDLRVESVTIELVYPVNASIVRLEKTNPASTWITLNEVEFFRRSPPVFAAAQSTTTGPGIVFDPYMDIQAASADDEDKNGVLDALPKSSITYTTQAPDGTIKPFVIGADGKVAAGTALGAWTFTYTATDKFGVTSQPLVRIITVTQLQANAPARTPPVILHNGSIVTGEIGATTITKGSAFDVFDKISARDTDGTAYTSTSPAPLNVRASYSRNGLNENFWNSNSTGTWVITYSFVDRFGIPQSNNIYRTVTVTP